MFTVFFLGNLGLGSVIGTDQSFYVCTYVARSTIYNLHTYINMSML